MRVTAVHVRAPGRACVEDMLAALLAVSIGIGELLRRDTIAGEAICDREALRTFYSRRELRPAWTPHAHASLLRALDRLDVEGLDPRRYHREALARIADDAERDVLASDAFFSAARHVSQGVTDPQFVRPSWCGPPARIDFPALLQAALDDGTVEETLAQLAPRHAGYVRLRHALASYRELAARGGRNVVPPGPSLRLDATDARVVGLRRRLYSSSDAPQFDAELDALVRHFQAHHGIEVGKQSTRTPFFAARIVEVIANPWWNVPESIATKELWPKQRRDASYFALFARSFPAFSHGCIRLERPLDLAAHLLRDQPQWTFHRDHYGRDATLFSC